MERQIKGNMKKVGGILLLVLTLTGVFGYYLYNKPMDSLEYVKPVASLSADSIFQMYERDEIGTNKLYLNKVIAVTGKIQSVLSDTSGVSINLQTTSGMFGVICKMETATANVSHFSEGQEVQVKGLCSGYLMDVVLVQCLVQ